MRKKILRKDTHIWLVGPRNHEMLGARFPTKRQVLSKFYHHLQTTNARSSATATATQLLTKYWNAEGITARKDCHVISMIEKLYKEHRLLLKNKSKTSKTAKERRRKYENSLDKVYDISHQDVLKKTDDEGVKKFILHMKETQKSDVLGSVNVSALKKEERAFKRTQATSKQLHKEQQRMSNVSSVNDSILDDPDSVIIADTEHNNDPNFVSPSHSEPKRKREGISSSRTPTAKRKIILTGDMCENLDRTKTSDRNGVRLLVSGIKACMEDPRDYTISRSSVRAARMKHRKAVDEQAKNSFNPTTKLCVQYDGKLVRLHRWKTKVDKLPIVVCGFGIEKLLSVATLPSGTAPSIGNAVHGAILDWGLQDSIIAQGFDTTSTNTGCKAGACLVLEKLLGKELLTLACRHHVFELIIGAEFEFLFGKSSDPNVGLFQYFTNCWSSLDLSNRQSGAGEPLVSPEVAADVIKFAKEQLSLGQPRGDYKELLELAIIIVGGDPDNALPIMAPGAMHHARWMAKIIFLLKMCIFMFQLILLDEEREKIVQFCRFFLHIYLPAWFTAPLITKAPSHDLNLLKKLDN